MSQTRSVIDKLLDSSTIIAFILGEPHKVDEDKILAGASISAVSLAEVVAILTLKGLPDDIIDATIADFGLKILAFDAPTASVAGKLIPKARQFNVGLGDCACIATGIVHGATIYTADRDWLALDLDADIRLIR